MYAIGHVALGYLVGKIVGREDELNVPLLLVLSVLPDIDLLFSALPHRGPTHSLLVVSMVFLPMLIVRFRKILPYYLALMSHIVVDSVVGWSKLFWPIQRFDTHIELGLTMGTVNEAAAEAMLFGLFLYSIIRCQDLKKLGEDKMRFLLVFLVPPIMSPLFFSYPISVPVFLLLPHLVFLLLVTGMLMGWLKLS